MFVVTSGLQISQECVHEVSVVLIDPGVVISTHIAKNCVSTFLETEEIREFG